jgi:hypothetical protein
VILMLCGPVNVARPIITSAPFFFKSIPTPEVSVFTTC